MPTRHRLLAVVVAVIWGVNFLAIDAALAQFPPMFAVVLRFVVLAVPTLLWVPRPEVPVRWLLAYGLGFGVLQFAFLYAGLAAGMPTGLASLVLQSSAPFTVVLGAALLRERMTPRAGVGLALAVLGLGVVGWSRADAGAGLLPFLLVLAGGLGWSLGNLGSRLARAPKPLHLTLWMSVVPPVPMLALALAVEGPARIGDSLHGLGARTGLLALAGLAYTAVIATVVGSGIWTWLMARHPAGAVAPFSMLVPVVGMSTAWLVLGERIDVVEAAGAILVIGGVLVGSRTGRRARPAPAPAARQVTPASLPCRT